MQHSFLRSCWWSIGVAFVEIEDESMNIMGDQPGSIFVEKFIQTNSFHITRRVSYNA